MTEAPKLPKMLAEIQAVVGTAAMLKIAHEKGGGRCSIRRDMDDDHWLVRLIGRELAEKLAQHFTSGRGSQDLEIPLGPAGTLAKMREKMGRMIEEDAVSDDEIARATGMSRRTVIRKRQIMKGQGELF